jgi:hypothetical protein
MVQILHVYLKNIHQFISYVFLAETKTLYFFNMSKVKKTPLVRFFFTFDPLEKIQDFYFC